MKNKKMYIKCTIIFIFSIILFTISFLLFKKSLINYSQETFNYTESNSIDYKVYLKENDFFEVPYLGKDSIYITSLIDYLDIDFNNNIKFDKNINGTYKYNIKAIVSASKVNDESSNFWQKEYELINEKTVDYSDTNVIDFKENVKVDYQKYNDLLLEFKKIYNLSLDGTLKIVMYVENTVNGDTGANVVKNSYSILSIPLTKATIEVPISITADNKSDVLRSDMIYKDDKSCTIYKIVSIVLFVIACILILNVVLRIVKNKEKLSIYKKQIKKILKEYDAIIVNLKSKIDVSNITVVDVNTFNELIDAHSEVRQPINFFENEDGAQFVLINDKMAWRYKLLRND